MRRVLNYFLQGLLITVPITVTFYVLIEAVLWIDDLIPLSIPVKLPGVERFDLPGVGLVLLFVGVTLLGYFGSMLVANPLFSFLGKMMEQTPLLKVIYTSVKDLVEAFVGEKKRFTQPVLVTVAHDPKIERIGFVTGYDLTQIGVSDGKVAVYLPFSYGFNGQLIIVNSENVVKLNASGTDMMKFVISGGVTDMKEKP
jgi:uncharacterized membrane protein